jgi:undecaprenyl-diphosphatase
MLGLALRSTQPTNLHGGIQKNDAKGCQQSVSQKSISPNMLTMFRFLVPFLAQTATETTTTHHQINLFQSLVLGFIQGVTEFLPISSTAHLKVIPIILGWGDPGVAYTAVIQLGSIAAVLWYFWKDLTEIILGAYHAITQSKYDSQEFRLALGIALGTLPIIFLGLCVKIFIPDFDNSPLRHLSSIAIASIFMSVLLAIAEKFGKRLRNFEDLTVRDGILMGLAQAMAIIPGVSRSGSTLTAGLFMKLERAVAARFSFLLGIPAITLAGLVELKGAIKEEGLGHDGPLALIVGVISATFFSYVAIAWLMKFLQTQNTWIFVWYRLAFGVAILTMLAGGVLTNI